MSTPPTLPMRRLQALDRRLGPALCALAAPPRLARRALARVGRWLDVRRGALRPVRPARRILLIKFWGIGSLQLLGPAVRALRERHPAAELTLLTLAQNREFVDAVGLFDAVKTLEVRRRGLGALLWDLARVTWRLRRADFDCVYDLEFLTRTSALVGALTGPRRLVGFSSPRAFRGGLHDETLPFDEARHVAACFRDLAAGEVLGEVHWSELVPPRTRAADAAAVGVFLTERLAPGARSLAVLNPNAGELAPERRWPPERFGALARALILDGFDVVVIGAASEAPCAAAVVAAAQGPAPASATDALEGRLLDLSGGLSLGELCALFARADLVVSNDSGPMHIAAALGAPTLGLFGPETPRRYGPIGPRAVALWDAPPCGPCINVHDNKLAECIYGRAECMLRLSVERVHAVALALARRAREADGPRADPANRAASNWATGSATSACFDRERGL
jgi:heptosyltransferase-3